MARRARPGPVEQPGLFDQPDEAPVPAPTTETRGPEKVRYEPYHGRAQCNDCELLVYQQLQDVGVSIHLIRQARVRRVGRDKTMLCHAHTHHRQEAEAVPNRRK